jgi:hypothetical protein
MAIHLESQQLIVLIYYPHTIKYEDRYGATRSKPRFHRYRTKIPTTIKERKQFGNSSRGARKWKTKRSTTQR